LGAEGVLAAPLPGELQGPGRRAGGQRPVDQAHHHAVLAEAGEGVVRHAVLVEVGLDQAVGVPLHGGVAPLEHVERRLGSPPAVAGGAGGGGEAQCEEQQVALVFSHASHAGFRSTLSTGDDIAGAVRAWATSALRRYWSIITAAMFPVPSATATCWVMGRRSPAIQTPGTLVSPRWDLGLACLPVGAISTPSCWARSVRPRASLETKQASAVSVVPSS